MVSDHGGACEVTDDQVEDYENKQENKQDMNSSEQAIGGMESLTSTNSSEEGSQSGKSDSEEKSFISSLYSFMKERGNAIERIPHLGFKQINLWKIYKAVEKLGGYEAVTSRRLWKSVYDELGGSPGSTSAATCTRRHYERLVLPFERQLRGEEDKPLPPCKPRKQYKRSPENRGNIAEIKKRRKPARDEREYQTPSGQCYKQGTQSHLNPWSGSSDCLDSEVSPGNTLPQISIPNRVISPLEKKKRLAQASLSLPILEESERPSVIQSPACPSLDHTHHSSDGSPLPPSSPSGSLSRSPSPFSVSSEECIVLPKMETESKSVPRLSSSKAAITGVCKPLGCYPNGQELVNHHRHHHFYRNLLHTGTPEKTQRSHLQWDKASSRLASHRLPLLNFTRPFWVPHTSSFSRSHNPCRPVPTFKPLLPYQPLPPKSAYLKKMTPHDTDRKEKAKNVIPKPLPTQQVLFHPHASSTVRYLSSRESAQGDLSVDQMKVLPMQPILLPSHLIIPPTQTHSSIVGTRYPGSYEAAAPSYTYPLSFWHP